jgi:hypothetical protein
MWVCLMVLSIVSMPTVADEILTLGQADRVNWLWLPTGPRDGAAQTLSRRCRSSASRHSTSWVRLVVRSK